ncbi:hypothetical protein UNDYM_2664 [Undibacterium sp. YM2]|uniref:glycosyl hydrolase n=1 Tax=Undibacterium sp. YM2 TaxID=2058625 RepID=UPI001331E4F4|nr:glycosyl hydrolase [Undibacterium sp. YM2]BBB66917.1 hypothetical protein UNDYM_2664 [Undibacterium sp. YM2]
MTKSTLPAFALNKLRTCVLLSLAMLCAAPTMAQARAAANSPSVKELAKAFATPPDDARPMVRWWWFGPSVEKKQLEREILDMKAGGFGGFEIQAVYPMELDDAAKGTHNYPYLSKQFLEHVSFANDKARANKLRVDITLGSGWPYGGPHVAVADAAGRLRVAVIELPAGNESFALPAIMNGEKLLASFVVDGTPKQLDSSKLQLFEPQLLASKSGRAGIKAAAADRVVVCYIASRTGQQVKRAALGAEGFVLDHLSRKAIDHHLKTVAEPLLKAFGKNPPYAVFSDSLEAYGTDWTDDFLAEFQRRRGYDLKPHLPKIESGIGADAAAIRRDWALTQTELANERYLVPVNQWAKAHGTRFRSQTYGEPAVTMSSNKLVDLPEGEGYQFRQFSFTRWATSAGHLYGRPVISAETWTWLHSPAFSATPLDMKVEADRMLLQGVNQFVGHGWPYTPPGTLEPGYAFYAAAVFNTHLPWWNVMPDVNGYLQRMSYLMRQGKPANQVAVFLPTDDVYATLSLGKVSVSAEMGKYVTPELSAQVLDAGHNIDYVDAESVMELGINYPVLILPHVSRLSPAVIAKLSDYVRAGGKIIAVGNKPSLAPGYLNAARISTEVQTASDALFANQDKVSLVSSDSAVGAALKAAVPADMELSAEKENIGFIRRQLPHSDVYFIANTSNRDVTANAAFRSKYKTAYWWNPYDGKISNADVKPTLRLAPYESRVLVLTDTPQNAAPEPKLADATTVVDLSRDWKVQFSEKPQAVNMSSLRSWTEDEATRYFSGIASYTKDLELSAVQLNDSKLTLDFGPGTPLEVTPKVPSGMRAMLDSPVREAAVVFVNGQRAGSVWKPPYQLDISKLLRAGNNRLEIQVANLGLNALAGHALPDYRLLSARYGQRFIPQDTHLIQAQPAGILGPVKLIGAKLQ